MKRYKYEIEPELLWALYWGNEYTIRDIAKLFNCSYCCIETRMNDYSIEKRHSHQWEKGHIPWCKGLKGIHLSPETEFKESYKIEPEILWALYHGNNHNTTEIGELFKCKPSWILTKMKKYGIPTRDRITAQYMVSDKKSEAMKGKIPWHKGKTAEEDPRIPHGKSHGMWNDDATNRVYGKRGIRLGVDNKMKKWRLEIFKRDRYTCKICGDKRKKGHRLIINAHHIKSFADIICDNDITSSQEARKCDELWDISNGITLCKDCHQWVHHMNPMNQQ